jgi:hypothetical protein
LKLPLAAAIVAGLLAAAPAGCGDDESPQRGAGAGGTQLSSPTRLRSSYALAGRERSVDTLIQPVTAIDPWRPPLAVAPAGERWVGITMRYVDRGRNPFPREWARFEATDERGAVHPGAVRAPPRRLYAGRRGPLFQTIGFAVPRGTRLASVHMTSIVKLWAFDVTWRLRPEALEHPARVG